VFYAPLISSNGCFCTLGDLLVVGIRDPWPTEQRQVPCDAALSINAEALWHPNLASSPLAKSARLAG
jgi:hypothetical protein